MDRRTWTTLIDYRNIDKEENGTLSILEDVTQALMLPNQPTKPIKRAGSKRRRSSALKGLVDGKIPVLGNQNEVSTYADFSLCTHKWGIIGKHILGLLKNILHFIGWQCTCRKR